MASVHRIVIGVALSCAEFVALAPGVCSAAPTAAEQAGQPLATGAPLANDTRRWYGFQTFAADGVAGALFLGAVADDHSPVLFGLSGLTFGLAAPAIHLAHGNWDVALGSLGLRVLGPFLGAVIGAQSDTRYSEDATGDAPSSKWATAGVAIGGLVASAIDGLLLGLRYPGLEPDAAWQSAAQTGVISRVAGVAARRRSRVFGAILSARAQGKISRSVYT